MELLTLQDVDPLLIPSDQDSPSHILNALNDHCLYEAFKRLHFRDLLNVANVCVRFQSQAKAAFSSKYKKLELDIRECDESTMRKVLETFGSSIQSLQISLCTEDVEADEQLFRSIIDNCSSKLKDLKLYGFDIQFNSSNLRLPFPQLELL